MKQEQKEIIKICANCKNFVPNQRFENETDKEWIKRNGSGHCKANNGLHKPDTNIFSHFKCHNGQFSPSK